VNFSCHMHATCHMTHWYHLAFHHSNLFWRALQTIKLLYMSITSLISQPNAHYVFLYTYFSKSLLHVSVCYTPPSSSSSIGTTTLSWVSACSTVVEHSQEEGFTDCHCQQHVKAPTWRRTRDLERSIFRHKRTQRPKRR
jgi:hypothetical protein